VRTSIPARHDEPIWDRHDWATKTGEDQGISQFKRKLEKRHKHLSSLLEWEAKRKEKEIQKRDEDLG
jgi:hypothetical protein